MVIVKVLNNNIAVAVDDAGRDVIVMGCGVAFRKRHGDEVDQAKVERLFTQRVPELSTRFGEMVAEVPEEYFEAAQHIITDAKLRLGRALDDNLYLALTDHIHFSVERCRKGIAIRNRLLFETKMIYREEFACAQEALVYLNERFAVELPEDEAAFIALHLVNADTGASMDETLQITRMVRGINGLIRNFYHVEIDPASLDYYRLMIHLKLFASRIVAGTASEPSQDRQLIEMVRSRYAQAYACAASIASFIGRTYAYAVSEDELMYLTIHLERVFGKRSSAFSSAPAVMGEATPVSAEPSVPAGGTPTSA